ncbi:hypothetical protein L1D15_15090 [Vibrio sp. Isolate25]|nr:MULTISPECIES: hypothetical protein [Vibrio]MCG9598044.1 hypothetical protein [Vibrio sp. Isolate25]MCG9678479.1 hypothetical protein [Vibrio sp. Isolate24]MCG9684259.1 hypothetical protein [Vibrio sp. Isolate23]USD31582.1 hypothetical protein J8Z27_09870 [Vibrio sp. SCSIO 43186]USD44625.1 hypothetical protein J4N38_10255 [Vibrio sp. SCSIO 43145]
MQIGATSNPTETSQWEDNETRNWLVSQPEEILALDDIIEESWRQIH